MKTETVTNEVGNKWFAIQHSIYFSYVAHCNGGYIGTFSSSLSAKKAINKAQGFRSKQWTVTFE